MGILSGLRVVEFSAFVAAPLAGATLASLGADVIRIEQRGGGIDAQRWPLHKGRSLYRAGLDRGKRSVALDLRSERGQELAAAIVTATGSDGGIFVTNLGGTGWASYEALSSARSDLIMVLLGGTADGRPAVDYTVNASIGFPLVTGPEGFDRPVNHVLPAWDVSAGLLAATGILAAERHRRLTGDGQLIELALADVALAVTDHLGFIDEARLEEQARPRLGNHVFGTYARDFRTGDGRDLIIVALTPRQWRSLGDATGLTAAFAEIEERHGIDLRNEGARFIHREEIAEILAPWVADRTLAEVAAALDANRVLWSPYRTFKEFSDDPDVESRRAHSPLRFTASPAVERPLTTEIGSDTTAVLGDLLGLDTSDLDGLRSAGVID